MQNVSTAENNATPGSSDETPRILQIVTAPPGLYARYLSGWRPSKTEGYEVQEYWDERVDALVLAEWPDGERNVYPITVGEDGLRWLWDAYLITNEALDEDDKYEHRKATPSS